MESVTVYEKKGYRLPKADYLAAVAAAGVDILFVLTGQRSRFISTISARPKRAYCLILDPFVKKIRTPSGDY